MASRYPQKARKKFNIENWIIIEFVETEEGLLLRPFNQWLRWKGLEKASSETPLNTRKNSDKNG